MQHLAAALICRLYTELQADVLSCQGTTEVLGALQALEVRLWARHCWALVFADAQNFRWVLSAEYDVRVAYAPANAQVLDGRILLFVRSAGTYNRRPCKLFNVYYHSCRFSLSLFCVRPCPLWGYAVYIILSGAQ